MSSPSSVRGDSRPEFQHRKVALYSNSTDALQAVSTDYRYWTAKLPESSFRLCLAIIAANWAAFGSVQKILNNMLAKYSLGLVIITLGLSLVGAKWMGELHRKRLKYAAEDTTRWEEECATALSHTGPWPFSTGIQRLAYYLRVVETWCPVLAGVLFLVALFTA